MSLERYQISVVFRTIGVLIVAGLLWYSPYSPFAMPLADTLYGQGKTSEALARYDRISKSSTLPQIRQAALHRSARIWAVALGNSEESRKRLKELLPLTTDPEALSALHERLAWLDLGDQGLRSAARHFERAYTVGLHLPEAPERLLKAAQLRTQLEHVSWAETLWMELENEYDAYANIARIGHGELLLRTGDPQGALLMYERVSDVDFIDDLDLHAMANLGSMTCLERLGDLTQAIAALDGADLREDIDLLRRQSLQERKSVVIGAM